ncbi:xanthine dehydrogenase accessory protein XdhC [Palleronia sediminis]|uniref:Xanthine dehydrogenase accessory protein XdhC n=1 Tax=Palleronia sediminis TaxID=2547833 RepID=A0A4R5ZUX2_9RHOB|nr:xanthine dehydrogenase accessory protein XdhC [Palleronia sediminis]TDL74841.1 xanthine dehydrogenase accessory protein XdhC [Palleronia sediminis]
MPGRLESFLASRPRVVRVRVDAVRGSAPRERDAAMFVAADAIWGTIGGGQLEYRMIDRARAMLAAGEAAARVDMALGPEIGQCCGGRVELALDLLDGDARADAVARLAAERAARPVVQIHGAGHVGRALAGCLAPLPVRATLIDSRAAELALCDAPVERCETALPEAEIRAAPPGTAFVVLTHDHALDFLLTAEALARGDAAYVGLIGSDTKRRRFERFHAAQDAQGDLSRLTCPIGATGSADKRPEVIAAFVAAEIMTALTTRKTPRPA